MTWDELRARGARRHGISLVAGRSPSRLTFDHGRRASSSTPGRTAGRAGTHCSGARTSLTLDLVTGHAGGLLPARRQHRPTARRGRAGHRLLLAQPAVQHADLGQQRRDGAVHGRGRAPTNPIGRLGPHSHGDGAGGGRHRPRPPTTAATDVDDADPASTSGHDHHPRRPVVAAPPVHPRQGAGSRQPRQLPSSPAARPPQLDWVTGRVRVAVLEPAGTAPRHAGHTAAHLSGRQSAPTGRAIACDASGHR